VRRPPLGFCLAVLPPLYLSGHLIREQTTLSWERGPQQVGFAFLQSGFGKIVLFTFCAALLYAVVKLVIALVSRQRRTLANIVGPIIVFLVALPVFVPYGVWVEAFAGRIARGEHAAAFLVRMAGDGEIRAVRALLDQGVPIDARNPRGLRAIDAAERQRQTEMRRFLVARGGAPDPRRPPPRRTDQAAPKRQ
jgi:hypothetical protein